MSACSQRTLGRTSWISGLLLMIPMTVGQALWAPAPASAQAYAAAARPEKTPKPPARYRETGQYRGSKAKEGLRAHRQRHVNRHLVSPVGGAANVRPGFYLGLGAQSGHSTVYGGTSQHHREHGYGHGRAYPQPYVVYINDSAIEPPIYGEPQYVEPRYAEPQPIYIINQQPAPQVIQVPAQPSAAPDPVYIAPPQVAQAAPSVTPPHPRSTEPQAVAIQVEPVDAEIYLDDELLGPASSVMSSLTSMKPSIYVLEVYHEDYSPQRLVFGISSDPVSISIDLTADRASRRARVK